VSRVGPRFQAAVPPLQQTAGAPATAHGEDEFGVGVWSNAPLPPGFDLDAYMHKVVLPPPPPPSHTHPV
jgi:hypothetical protein